MDHSIKISTAQEKIRNAAIVTALIALFYVSVNALDLDIQKFMERLGNTANVVQRLMTIDLTNISEILSGTISSVLIAVVSLFMGGMIAIVLSFLAADNIAPSKILSVIIKGSIAVVRAVPALVWILLVVASIGFGNAGGMTGLIFPTVGYLTKSFTASIEDMGYQAIEALQTTGANRLAIITKALIPGVASSFVSWTSIRFEGNIAESINLGMVGVGGVGSILMKSLGKYEYGSITAAILVIFTTMFAVELMVNKLRRKI